MKQHKVIATIMETVYEDRFHSHCEKVATYERVYRSKSAALKDMREMCKLELCPLQHLGHGHYSGKFHLAAFVEDVEDGRRFNRFERGCVDINHSMEPDEAENANCDQLIETLEARGFSKVA